MTSQGRGPPPKGLWAYAYDVALPEKDDRIRRIQDLLDEVHSEARDGVRVWAGRLLVEPPITRILVVSDSPEQYGVANLRIEAALRRMGATFEVTVPMAVVSDADAGPTN